MTGSNDKAETATGARRDLSTFLKNRRARIAPADVGLAAGSGRRTAGLRREEVAHLAGVGLTWYTWFEQGRAIRVSASFLDNLARALRLDRLERDHLFTLALARPAAPERPAASSETISRLRAILEAIDGPAYLRDDCFDVLAWNAANTAMFGDFAAVPAPERNVVRLMFGRAGYRRTMENWEEDARNLLAKLRLNAGRAGETGAASVLIDDMMAASADFARIWAEHAVGGAGEGVTLYRTARHGRLTFRHSTLMPEARPDLRIVVFTPVRQEP